MGMSRQDLIDNLIAANEYRIGQVVTRRDAFDSESKYTVEAIRFEPKPWPTHGRLEVLLNPPGKPWHWRDLRSVEFDTES